MSCVLGSGVIGTARGRGPNDHLCLAYDDRGEFQSRVLEFLAGGLAQGRRVCYAANRNTAALWDDLRDLDETVRSDRPDTVQAALQPAAGELVIDATYLDFIDHRSMIALADYARSLATTIVLRTDLPGPARIIEILDFPTMRVEPSA